MNPEIHCLFHVRLDLLFQHREQRSTHTQALNGATCDTIMMLQQSPRAVFTLVSPLCFCMWTGYVGLYSNAIQTRARWWTHHFKSSLTHLAFGSSPILKQLLDTEAGQQLGGAQLLEAPRTLPAVQSNCGWAAPVNNKLLEVHRWAAVCICLRPSVKWSNPEYRLCLWPPTGSH